MEAKLAGIDWEKLLHRALRNGGDYAELYGESRRGTSIISEARRIETFLITEEYGVGIRVVRGDRAAYAYTNDLASLTELADTVASAVNSGEFAQDISLEPRPPRSMVSSNVRPSDVDSEQKIDLILRA
ncbi:MAG: PmbA/TldA family metallopeptidase, partial [Desulfomonilia bacterium]